MSGRALCEDGFYHDGSGEGGVLALQPSCRVKLIPCRSLYLYTTPKLVLPVI